MPAGPFAQINQPATFAAEREVLGRFRSRFLADRTFRVDLGLARHESIVDGKLPGREDAAGFDKNKREAQRE